MEVSEIAGGVSTLPQPDPLGDPLIVTNTELLEVGAAGGDGPAPKDAPAARAEAEEDEQQLLMLRQLVSQYLNGPAAPEAT